MRRSHAGQFAPSIAPARLQVSPSARRTLAVELAGEIRAANLRGHELRQAVWEARAAHDNDVAIEVCLALLGATDGRA